MRTVVQHMPNDEWRNREALERLYNAELKSLTDIGKLYGVSKDVVRYHMRRLGIDRRKDTDGMELKANERRLHFVCATCGMDFHVPISEMKRRTPKYCSSVCFHVGARGKPLKEDKDVNTMLLARRMRKSIGRCQSCGFDEEPRILTLHHIDRDRSNGIPDNLLLLCPNCHSLKHLSNGTLYTPIVVTGKRGRKPASEWLIKGERECTNCGTVFQVRTLNRRFCYDCVPISAPLRIYKYIWSRIKAGKSLNKEEIQRYLERDRTDVAKSQHTGVEGKEGVIKH